MIQVIVKKFGTKWRPNPKRPAEMQALDWVEYSPLGSVQKTVIFRYIAEMQPISVEGNLKAEQNPTVAQANALWNTIKPQYEAWKEGRKAPIDGTPLAAWSYVSEELADLLRFKGVHTVEQLAQLTDTHKQSMGVPGLGDMIENAKRFVLALDKNQVTAALEKKDSEIAELKAQMAELAEKVTAVETAPAPKKRGGWPKGKPRKLVEQSNAEQVASAG